MLDNVNQPSKSALRCHHYRQFTTLGKPMRGAGAVVFDVDAAAPFFSDSVI